MNAIGDKVYYQVRMRLDGLAKQTEALVGRRVEWRAWEQIRLRVWRLVCGRVVGRIQEQIQSRIRNLIIDAVENGSEPR
jgi:hypothetical protein